MNISLWLDIPLGLWDAIWGYVALESDKNTIRGAVFGAEFLYFVFNFSFLKNQIKNLAVFLNKHELFG